ncbi:hypothetical protein [Domibacillus robiginosus]|uniref:hypothetical protein n=1 Tax=Domibacillus robiginosus TaxID=1071054 RepID=UPI00067D4FC9|nr:hypothetical protein [Domibacillus robiginosus]
MYNVMLFFHVLGTVIMFAAVGVTLTAMVNMLYCRSTAALQSWCAAAVKMDGLMPISVIFILFPGLYLVISLWGWSTAWINISLALLVMMTVLGPIVNLPRLKAILTAANAETKSTPSAAVMEKVQDRVLWHSAVMMTMLTIAILFLMTVKPALPGSLIALAAAVIASVVVTNGVLKRALSSPSISSTASWPAKASTRE